MLQRKECKNLNRIYTKLKIEAVQDILEGSALIFFL